MPQPVGPSRWALPGPETADDAGLVAFGADLEPATLVDAYRRGLFPWPHDDLPLPWFSPDPRALLFPGAGRVSRSLRQRLRRSGWTTTIDTAFDEVTAACAERREDDGGSWITPAMRAAYAALHRLGWAHSLEVWDVGELVGGLYGVQVGGVFTGESMFHRATDASKVALVDLTERFGRAGGTVIDAQLPTEHLARMGAVAVSRSEFLGLLHDHRDDDVTMATGRLPVARLSAP